MASRNQLNTKESIKRKRKIGKNYKKRKDKAMNFI